MKTLLSKTVVLTPADEKTNIPLDFTVGEEAEKIAITYSYSPKQLEEGERARLLIEQNLENDTHGDRALYPQWQEYLPLKNLVTLSLDSPCGYVGAAHRQDEKQHHIISKDFSSRGFNLTEIYQGDWTVTLNVHALVTQECECQITVETGGAQDE